MYRKDMDFARGSGKLFISAVIADMNFVRKTMTKKEVRFLLDKMIDELREFGVDIGYLSAYARVASRKEADNIIDRYARKLTRKRKNKGSQISPTSSK